MASLFSLAVLLCLPWMVLGQEDDCLTRQGQEDWGIRNLDPFDCGLPFKALLESLDDPQLEDASKIPSVSSAAFE